MLFASNKRGIKLATTKGKFEWNKVKTFSCLLYIYIHNIVRAVLRADKNRANQRNKSKMGNATLAEWR